METRDWHRPISIWLLGIFLSAIPGLGLARAEPAITLWYGDEQRFGGLGNPQPRISLLGIVSEPDTVEALTFTLNGGAVRPLTIGADGRRLSRPGAFNVEIERNELQAGTNTVVIAARLRHGDRPVEKSVRVDYTPGRTWPLPYSIKWSEVSRIHDVAEPIDGNWQLTPAGVRTLDPYYDRVLAIGDMSWTDYEVVTSVIFHRSLAQVGATRTPPFLNHWHGSVLLRWRGHRDDGRQPRAQWRPTGGLAMWRGDAGKDHNYWVWHGGESGILEQESPGRPLEFGRPYRIRARVESLPGPQTRYSVRGWDARQPEPGKWDLVAVDGPQDMQSGSLLFVAHHADVTFGDVEVRPLR